MIFNLKVYKNFLDLVVVKLLCFGLVDLQVEFIFTIFGNLICKKKSYLELETVNCRSFLWMQ